jgi:energy-coupling factor transport system ATP-binding protein
VTPRRAGSLLTYINKSHDRGVGLGLLPAGLRLLLTIAVIVGLQYVHDLRHITYALIVAILLLILNLRVRLPRVFSFSIIITFTAIFFGNLLLPDFDCKNSDTFYLPFVRACSIQVASVLALRRVAMLCFGFAWLNATDAIEMAQLTELLLRPLSSGSRPYNRLGMAAFTIFNRLLDEYSLLTQSIALRLRNVRRSFRDKSKFKIVLVYYKTTAVLLRLFSTIPKIAFAVGMHGRSTQIVDKIAMESVCAGYDAGVNILTNVTFTAKRGDFVLLTGPSGSGKTTLLRVIARYIPRIKGFASGKLSVGNEIWLPSLVDLAETLPNVRMVTPDTYEFFLALNVRQELLLHTDDEIRASNAARSMGLIDLLDRDILTLSGGQKMRLVLACVLASEAVVLLLDNPMSQLDASAQSAFLEALAIYIAEKSPIIFVSDRTEQAFYSLANRYFALAGGEVLEIQDHPRPPPAMPLPSQRRTALESSDLPPLAGLANATVTRAGRRVLDGFTFEVYPGEIIAVVGPNGSGKTTAMLALSGLLKLQKGIRFGAAEVGLSFQEPRLQFVAPTTLAELRVKGELTNSAPARLDAFCERELSWLQIQTCSSVLDLSDFHSRLLSVSSMLYESAIIILDEPTTQVPSDHMPILFSRLTELAASGFGVIIVTHVLELAHLCDRVVELSALSAE